MPEINLTSVPPLKLSEATDEQFAALWANGWGSGQPGNVDLFRHVGLYFGGIPGDWITKGLIPDLPAEQLRYLTVDQWRQWRLAQGMPSAMPIGLGLLFDFEDPKDEPPPPITLEPCR